MKAMMKRKKREREAEEPNDSSEDYQALSLQVSPVFKEQIALYTVQSVAGSDSKTPRVVFSKAFTKYFGVATVHYLLDLEERPKDSLWEPIPLACDNLSKLAMPMKFKLPSMKNIKEKVDSGFKILVEVKIGSDLLASTSSVPFQMVSRHEYMSKEGQELRDSRHKKKNPQEEFNNLTKSIDGFLQRNTDSHWVKDLVTFIEGHRSNTPFSILSELSSARAIESPSQSSHFSDSTSNQLKEEYDHIEEEDTKSNGKEKENGKEDSTDGSESPSKRRK
eukprot:TRINITY_DN8298_c0_g1_i1.p1 TRINITY_DN8298_c0_g1~~TRINITY_DN8298_c0_g1_i1.p1  ORF type:complete len:277 (+),score=107.60 TRINITY_DN8298_c0_g1_i1:114-944(+)